MKFFTNFRLIALLLLGLALGGVRTQAAGFSFTLTASTNLFYVNVPVTNVITVTNLTGLTLTNVYVSNLFSAHVFFAQLASTNYPAGSNDTSLTFSFHNFTNNGVVQLGFVWQPLLTGPLTNTVTVGSSDVTNTASVTLVIPVYSVQADLKVAVSLVSQLYITNDWVTYGVSLTNQGPNPVAGVFLTNTLPPGVILRGYSPASPAPTISSNNLIFSLGTLSNNVSVKYQFTIQPTNAAALFLTASAGAAGLYDTNSVNNQATNVMFVINYPPGTLLAITNSAQAVDLQNGLREQTILVTNIGTTNVDSVRVVVTGLTNILFNASGTNNGNPYVVYATQLKTNSSIKLRLLFSPRVPFPFTNSQLQAYAVPLPNYTPPAAAGYNTNLNIYRIVQLTNNGDMLLEFTNLGPCTVVYSDNVQFSNAMIAPPAINSAANRIQWQDYGPPATTSAPTNSAKRFYRVFLNP